MKLMRHPQHGQMNVYTDGEQAAAEALGWSLAPVAPPPVVEPDPKPQKKSMFGSTQKDRSRL